MVGPVAPEELLLDELELEELLLDEPELEELLLDELPLDPLAVALLPTELDELELLDVEIEEEVVAVPLAFVTPVDAAPELLPEDDGLPLEVAPEPEPEVGLEPELLDADDASETWPELDCVVAPVDAPLEACPELAPAPKVALDEAVVPSPELDPALDAAVELTPFVAGAVVPVPRSWQAPLTHP